MTPLQVTTQPSVTSPAELQPAATSEGAHCASTQRALNPEPSTSGLVGSSGTRPLVLSEGPVAANGRRAESYVRGSFAHTQSVLLQELPAVDRGEILHRDHASALDSGSYAELQAG